MQFFCFKIESIARKLQGWKVVTHTHTKPDLLITGEWEGLKLRERFKVTGKEGPVVVVMEKMNREQLNALFSIFHTAKPRMVPLHQKI